MTAYTANARWRHATTMADAVAAALTGTQTKTASNGCGASIRLTYEAEPPRTMDIQQPATLAESRKAPIVVGSGDLLCLTVESPIRQKPLSKTAREKEVSRLS